MEELHNLNINKDYKIVKDTVFGWCLYDTESNMVKHIVTGKEQIPNAFFTGSKRPLIVTDIVAKSGSTITAFETLGYDYCVTFRGIINKRHYKASGLTITEI